MTGQIKVGVAVLIRRESCYDDIVIVGKRKGSGGAGTWSPPGGGLEFGESTEACARREVMEETGLALLTVTEPFTCTNDVTPDGMQWITLWVRATIADGDEPQLMEPDKCEGWHWHQLFRTPRPWFRPFDILLTNIVKSGEYDHDIVTNLPVKGGNIQIGDYVFVDRFGDCLPGNPWAVGYVTEVHHSHVFLGCVSSRKWRYAMPITEEQGQRIAEKYPKMEYGPSRPCLEIARIFDIEGI